ncbi:hypothetical protein [Nocardioides mesophilus]|uniref:Uncharacterized protein n=1 Tax=Nocardioides mesophilus TaxID=433659 RepID=A0A7G9RAL7_9ACTN|nr:hypothetical protein [Nocardioides mesophilus]QNN52642.1 hypothetical protein H9L09_19705 [Nocardioides mesophilus]
MNTADEPAWYEIRFQGHLDPKWAAWFDGFSLEPQADGITVLRGRVVDQAALHGLLGRLRDLGLPLLDVVRDPGAGSSGR